MVSTLESLGVRSINACVGAAEPFEAFTRRCAKIIRAVVHIDVEDVQFVLFHRAMQSIYRIAKSHSAVAGLSESDRVSRSTRPAFAVLHDRLKRTISVRQSLVSKHAAAGHLSGDSFPKIRISLSQASAPSSCVSFRYDVPLPTYKGVRMDPIPPLAARSGFHPAEFPHPPPDGGSESPASRAQLPTMDSSRPAFGVKLKQAAWLLSEEFPNTSALLCGFRDAKLNKERIAILTLDAIMQRCKYPASTRAVIKNVSGLIQFSPTLGESVTPME